MYTIFKTRLFTAISAALMGIVVFSCVANAASTTTIPTSKTGQPVTQSYNAGPSVLPSMLVENKSNDKNSVVALPSSDISKMLGVVIPQTSATIVLTPQNDSSQQVYVAPSGRYYVLVSNQQGNIKAGDYLEVSSIPGIAMLATSQDPLIIGRAVDSFSSSKAIGNTVLQNPSGKAVTVAIGRTIVDLQLAPNPLYLKNSNSVLVFLTRAEYDVTNKAVSPIRTYLSGLIFLATIIISIVVLYSGTRSSIISVGRNPLAKQAISRSLARTVIAGILVFVFGILTVYLLLNK